MAKKAKNPKLSDLDLGALLTEIEKAEKEVQIAEIELDARKEAAKSAKSEWMVKVADLRQKVRTRERLTEEAKRQPLLNPKKNKAADKLPDGAKEAKTIGMLRDVLQENGVALINKGEQSTGYIDADGKCFLMITGKRVDLVPEDWCEIVEDKGAKASKTVELLADVDFEGTVVAKVGDKVTVYVDDADGLFLVSTKQADGSMLGKPIKIPLAPGEVKEIAAAEANGQPQAAAVEWRKTRIDRSGLFTEKAAEALELAGIRTLGGLQELMAAHGQFWTREMKINGRFKESVETAFNDYLIKIQAQ